MIKSFSCKESEKVFWNKSCKKFPISLLTRAKIKLDMLEVAHSKDDLRVPPANHLEELKGKLKGFMSIRINKQFRVVFRFDGSDAYDVYIDDYH
ncbi:MAG: type II toxin-antitoxin system RelE/ParE family toxin [Campylobacterota bacterium]|nr:type II toxin-antitoxin system RelE/ParE family toxin [Campylobacterota bacterium]